MAVPDVVITAAGRRVVFPSPRAKKPAHRSSKWTHIRIRDSRAQAITKGVDLDPGARQTCSTPARANSSMKALTQAVVTAGSLTVLHSPRGPSTLART